MGSAPTVMQAPPETEKDESQVMEPGLLTAVRKLTYSAGSQSTKQIMVEVDKDNIVQTQGIQLKFYPSVVKDGVKMAKLNPQEIEQQLTTPTVLLHDDGYFIFRFESMEDKNLILQNGPYTFNNRPMVLKDWDPDFQIQNEFMRIAPIWVNLLELPIQCWAEENLGRIASLLGKSICTDKLTAQCERVSYARVLIEMDITQPLPDEVLIEKPYGSSWMQRVDFEWKSKL
uniref:DUF4283 domain-containing protein n=1 Tax=Nicotiana tabacum TaxID=4097 RepID=A0A1S3YMU7_TOBAC|nr:PREDICTED: uncharacterized protein LOC107777718 [Nicotiana tabacum]